MIKDLLSNYIYGYYGDPLDKLYQMSQAPAHLLQGQTLQWLTLLGTAKIFGSEVVAYNLVTIFSYLFCFGSVFFFVKWLTKSRCAAVISATIFVTCQYLQWQGTQHIELVLAAGFLPIYLGRLFIYLKSQTSKNAFWLALAFSAVFLTSFYYGYFLIVVTAVLAILSKPKFKPWALFALLAAIFTLPATQALIKFKLGIDANLPAVSGIQTTLSQNTLDQVFRLTARPWDYLLPSINHPLFGSWIRNFYENVNPGMSWQAWSAYLPERAVYIGWTAIALTIVALCETIKKKNPKPTSHFPHATAVIVVTITALWLSLPPYVSIQSHIIPVSPSYFLFKLFPMFRAYIRFAVLVQLGIAILAGAGFQRIAAKLYRKPAILGFALLLCSGLIVFENLSLPLPFIRVNQLPPVYQYIKETPGVVKVAEFPWDGGAKSNCGGYNYTYSLNFQRLHHKEVLLPPNPNYSLESQTTYNFLKTQGVTHIAAHTKDYFALPQNPLDQCQPYRFYEKEPEVYEKFKKVAEFEDGIVYAL